MANMSEIITKNIIREMQRLSKKQIDLANDISVSKQTMSKMLSGERTINAVELAMIAKALNVSIDVLVKLPSDPINENPIRAFMGKFDSKNAKEGLEIADKVADIICFHARCKDNGENMSASWR